jgi:FkbM family methyltransferase
MVRGLILNYLRNFPIDHFKNKLERFIKLPKNEVLYTNPYGIKFKLDLNDHVMRNIYLRGVYERNTFRHLCKIVKPQDTFVDVGANIGAYSIGLSPFLNKGKIISFEPNPRAIQYLEENIRHNKLKNITVNRLGLSDNLEKATLYNTSNLTTASLNVIKNSDQKEETSLITLDKYCKDNNIDKIDILKIDIEGHEYKAIKGAVEIITKSKSMVLVAEINDCTLHTGHSKQELFEFIVSLGFNAFLPKGFPFKLRKVNSLPDNYQNNIVFIK